MKKPTLSQYRGRMAKAEKHETPKFEVLTGMRLFKIGARTVLAIECLRVFSEKDAKAIARAGGRDCVVKVSGCKCETTRLNVRPTK
jgi:hypothetical protein